MSYYYRQVQLGPGVITPFIKNVIIINVAVFLLQSILISFTGVGNWPAVHFGMTPSLFLRGFHLWMPLTYMFLHGGLIHLLFNMFFLWMFGTEIEQRMGSRRFGTYYLFCGVGAGLISYIFNVILAALFPLNYSAMLHVPTIGASGAIYGVMLAFGLFFPNRMILVFFVLPIKAFVYIILMGLVELYMLVFNVQGGVSYIAHVSGMLLGYLFLRYEGAVAGTVAERTEREREKRRAVEAGKSMDDQKKIDEILDKINTEGMHKLSRAERNFLRDRAKKRRG